LICNLESSANLQDKVVGAIIYFPYLTLLFSIIIIVIERKSGYCLYHAYQGLFVAIAYIIGAIVFGAVDAIYVATKVGFNAVS
jgi:hypothetical protein